MRLRKDTGSSSFVCNNSFFVTLTRSPNGARLFGREAESFESRHRRLVVIPLGERLGGSLVRVVIVRRIACQLVLLQFGVGASAK